MTLDEILGRLTAFSTHEKECKHCKIAISQAQLHLDALYKAKYLGMLPKIDAWQCDNVNCGKGAICNFCALRSQLVEIKAKLNQKKELEKANNRITELENKE